MSWLGKLFRRERTWRLHTSAFAKTSVSGEVTTEPRFFTRRARSPMPTGNSTREFFWDHPKGYPFQVYGGPEGGDEMPTTKPWQDWMEVWTDLPVLDGYELVVDEYSDRAYHVWKSD